MGDVLWELMRWLGAITVVAIIAYVAVWLGPKDEEGDG